MASVPNPREDPSNRRRGQFQADIDKADLESGLLGLLHQDEFMPAGKGGLDGETGAGGDMAVLHG